jgi:hypothetical protein
MGAYFIINEKQIEDIPSDTDNCSRPWPSTGLIIPGIKRGSYVHNVDSRRAP